jgi:hypothetical protein
MSRPRDMMREPILQIGTDKMILRYAIHKLLTVRSPDRSKWQGGIVSIGKGGFMWYRDGSKTNGGTEVTVYGKCTRQKFIFGLGQYTKVLQVYAIKASTNDNTKRG